ncbi:hypothetical protein NIES4071_53390 [Calothrix sp. NIES-4071]|nr:hypothetical protein NIES4071_53390 [Calothrix sp. NIES-4071]BAZ59647.1 hypothetical protein NIES4105_53340 [Calothrix sp. NIES-4105]
MRVGIIDWPSNYKAASRQLFFTSQPGIGTECHILLKNIQFYTYINKPDF